MKRVYGANVYNEHFVHDWIAAAEECVYMPTPLQGANECGFYAMKIACLFDGLKLVQNIKNKDVSATVLFSARTFFFVFLSCVFIVLFIYMQSRVEHWKAEYMYQLMFHHNNICSPLTWPAVLQDLVIKLGMGTPSFREELIQAAEARRRRKK